MRAALLTVLLSVSCLATTAGGQAAIALRELTVAPERLPPGCGLTSSPSMRISDNQWLTGLWAGFPSNPWLGVDRAILASIAEQLVASPPVPDGPPLSKPELALFRLRLADGVEEGYGAVYTDEGRSLGTVYAVRYAADATPMPTRAAVLRFASDRIVVLVSGSNSACLQAVRSHVEQLAVR